MATIHFQETYSGGYTITPPGYTGVTGFDHPQTFWNDPWWTNETPSIDNTYPVPGGVGGNSFCMYMDCGHTDAVGLGYLDLHDFYFRTYIRFGDADSFSTGLGWAKLMRFFGSGWQWHHILDEENDLYDLFFTAEAGGQETCYIKTHNGYGLPAPIGVGCKWYYWEMHIILNTPGSANGVWELRWRNVTDGGSLVSYAWTGLNLRGSSSAPLDTFRVGGNNDPPPNAADAIVRYNHVALASGGWIGEVGAGGSTYNKSLDLSAAVDLSCARTVVTPSIYSVSLGLSGASAGLSTSAERIPAGVPPSIPRLLIRV